MVLDFWRAHHVAPQLGKLRESSRMARACGGQVRTFRRRGLLGKEDGLRVRRRGVATLAAARSAPPAALAAAALAPCTHAACGPAAFAFAATTTEWPWNDDC